MFTLEYVKNPQWNGLDHTSFSCMVKFAEFNEELPFGCFPEDQYTHVQEVWNRTTAGEFGEIAEYVEYAPEAAPDQPIASGVQTL